MLCFYKYILGYMFMVTSLQKNIHSFPQTKADSTIGDLIVKSAQNTTVSSDVDYKDRVSLTPNLSLRIARAKLSDEKTFTCMVVQGSDIAEYPVQVIILSKQALTTLNIKPLGSVNVCSSI